MLRVSPKQRRNIVRILPFGLIWLFTGWVFLWVEQAMIVDIENYYAPESVIELSPKIILFASISGFGIGCLVGFLELTIINNRFIHKSFPQKIFGKLLIYLLFMFFTMFVFYQIAASIEMEKSVFSHAVFQRYLTFLTSATNASTFVQLAFSLLISLIYAEINDHLGQGVLLNFFTGKYHSPKLEQRVFLFTDMKASTEIAEQLGHLKYFELLRDYYNSLSDAIINNNGEVYQYIGDEIVISWQANGKRAIQDALNCFDAMKADLLDKQVWFSEKYNISPGFKGGLHWGEVTVGEIGALKKEIFFTGDVLNTAARIQSLCSVYEKDLLISDAIVNEFKDQNKHVFKLVDEVQLKGKKRKSQVFEVLNH